MWKQLSEQISEVQGLYSQASTIEKALLESGNWRPKIIYQFT
jgi:hypothetical protein